MEPISKIESKAHQKISWGSKYLLLQAVLAAHIIILFIIYFLIFNSLTILNI